MQVNARETIVLAVALLIVGILFLSPAYVRPDSVAVYSYLRSAIFDGDLLFLDEWNSFGLIRDGFPLFKEITPLGTLANHWWIGTAIASAPFYLAARAIGNKDGFFGVYGWTLAWASVLFTFVTLRIAGALAEQRRWIAIAAALFGTPLFWYTFRFPLGTHAAGAMFIALAAYAALKDREFASGLMLGLAIATRLQHFVLLPAFVVLAIRRRVQPRATVRAAIGVLLGALPQAIAWFAIYGSPLGPLTSGASLAGTTWMPFRSLAFGAVLFSSYHGLFIWSPVVLLAIVGWIEGLRTNRDAALLFLLMFAGEWVANAAFDRYFWGGMSFGPRRWVDLAAPLAVGIAWFARSAVRTIAVVATTLWSGALTAGALAGTLPLARYVSFAGLWPRIGPIELHSFVSDRSIDCLVALLLVVAIAALFPMIRRYAVPLAAAYVVLATIALAAMIPATRARAPQELARFGIRPRLARVGPLLDERRLLGDEVDYLRAAGREDRARQTEREIGEIDRIIRDLNKS